jgi:hypothetical protein
MNKALLISVSLIAAAGLVLSQDTAKKTASTLHPEMTVGPDAGSYDKPMGTLGDKPADPWSATSIAAGVNKTPEPGHVVTRTGEIIDLSCYLQLGKHGEKHKACGTKCLQNNQPIGLLTSDGTVYMLMEEEHDPRRDGQVKFRQAAIDHFAHIMEVTGTETAHGGFKAIYVQGYVNK